MEENRIGKVIVSMTSYPKRISNVGRAISHLLSGQSFPPDEIHLWLARPEFPNLEKDLPEDLIHVISTNEQVYLHWLEKNTFCHKRYEIFNTANGNDCVFFIDDDVYYDDKLIETVLLDHKKHPEAIIPYEWQSEHLYEGKRIIYANEYKCANGPSIRTRFCGQSMIPVNVFPKVLLSEEMKEIRDRCSPVDDESWINPWAVFYEIPIYCEHFGYGVEIDPVHIKMCDGIVGWSHRMESNGLKFRENWLSAVLDAFPQIKEKYVKLFNYGH